MLPTGPDMTPGLGQPNYNQSYNSIVPTFHHHLNGVVIATKLGF